jgi:hypothetical protein
MTPWTSCDCDKCPSWPVSNYYPSMCLERQSKTTRLLVRIALSSIRILTVYLLNSCLQASVQTEHFAKLNNVSIWVTGRGIRKLNNKESKNVRQALAKQIVLSNAPGYYFKETIFISQVFNTDYVYVSDNDLFLYRDFVVIHNNLSAFFCFVLRIWRPWNRQTSHPRSPIKCLN